MGSGDEFSEEAFDEVFKDLDKDGNGYVTKDEMATFIRGFMS